ncbi:hypothetical protein BU24DRAFT_419876 [Aaosphaeria arxii CBS 175.79]|uniref:Uncharacterized protein n=1 Tax=Aaosphaeria arxii CBS 175.79 TaxID=1450172 RepID=A0A6A5Y431_9PLEO|nr:uncharacterized protein BU24DRAFT_419876 [Aaosphaeria arxii CBS 175.79]KAF2020335.1 hypothetical protein BU24DRAFT_419876 [Aaosphaeria arxii CBS 175.79]
MTGGWRETREARKGSGVDPMYYVRYLAAFMAFTDEPRRWTFSLVSRSRFPLPRLLAHACRWGPPTGAQNPGPQL